MKLSSNAIPFVSYGFRLAILLLFAAPSFSASADCDAAVTSAQMLQCAGENFERADAELNHAYRELLSRLDDSRKTQLREAQRAWIAFRDAQARFEGGSAADGSLEPILSLSAKAALTEQRTEQLKSSPP